MKAIYDKTCQGAKRYIVKAGAANAADVDGWLARRTLELLQRAIDEKASYGTFKTVYRGIGFFYEAPVRVHSARHFIGTVDATALKSASTDDVLVVMYWAAADAVA